jgi:hypothetical protein
MLTTPAMPSPLRGVLLVLAAGVAPLVAIAAQSAPPPERVAIVYTGRSLGALGVRRAQDEHELLTEQARAEGLPFKLVSHPAWRAPGIVVFLPSSEPSGGELAEVIARRGEAELAGRVQALASANVVLLQDPWNEEPDLLAMLSRNPRRRAEFPDLTPVTLRVSRLRSAADDRIIIVEQPGAVWPTDPTAWSLGEMNRVDVGEARLFELPVNLGGIGPRATLLRGLRDDAARPAALTITADLGHQDGDVGVPRPARARVDFSALDALGYGVLVPFELELALGVEALTALHREFPRLTLLASNLTARDTALFTPRLVVDGGGRRIGLVGLVNPSVRDRLPRGVLAGFTVEPPVVAARREVARLRAAGAQAVVVLSNLDPGDNAVVAQEVQGIDAIVADLPVRAAPEAVRVRVELPDRPFVRPGTPALVARSVANGLGVGRLDLEFRTRPDTAGSFLAAVEHRLAVITDRVPSDTALVRRLVAMAGIGAEERGELLFPAFPDIVARHPDLAEVDATTRRGRVSKALWESFMARRVRVQANTEVAILRRLDQFPPLVGKLHEHELDEWLWTEDQLVVLDLPGADLKALLRADTRNDLATSGIDLAAGTVLGHPIRDDVSYRVATSDVVVDGARARFFGRAHRQRRRFRNDPVTGAILAEEQGPPLAVNAFIAAELRRVRRVATGEAQIDSIAAQLAPDPAHVDLVTFAFERPTIWASLNHVTGNDGYTSVPESRVRASDAWVAGVSGRFVLSKARRFTATDLGLGFAFAQQHVTGGTAGVLETADDIKLDLTVRPSGAAPSGSRRVQPFVRGLFDTEFSPTINQATGIANPRQLSLRAVGGVQWQPNGAWQRADAGLVLENDFGRPNPQVGVQARADLERRVGQGGAMTYRLRNDLTYFLPTGQDTPADLALRYNMVHELLVPLVDELSLSISADLFFFQGKVPATSALGASSQLRVGLTYDRLWKPRYQPFL